MWLSIARGTVILGILLSAGGAAVAQDQPPDAKQARKPLAIFQGDGYLNRARSFEQDRNNRCEMRSSLSLTLYEGGRIQYKNMGPMDLRTTGWAEGDAGADQDQRNRGGQSFSLVRKGGNRTFNMVGQISADRSRVTGSWTEQVRLSGGQGAGRIGSTCFYTFDLPRLA